MLTQMLDGRAPLLFPLFILFWLGCYGFAIRFMWKALAPVQRARFSFYITDYWVGMLCVAPTLAALGHVAMAHYDGCEWDAVFLGVAAASQVLGIALALIFSLPREGEIMPRRSDQAVWVLIGAFLFGVMGLAAVISLFYLFYFFVLLLVSCPPLFIFGIVFTYLLSRAWRKAKGK